MRAARGRAAAPGGPPRRARARRARAGRPRAPAAAAAPAEAARRGRARQKAKGANLRALGAKALRLALDEGAAEGAAGGVELLGGSLEQAAVPAVLRSALGELASRGLSAWDVAPGKHTSALAHRLAGVAPQEAQAVADALAEVLATRLAGAGGESEAGLGDSELAAVAVQLAASNARSVACADVLAGLLEARAGALDSQRLADIAAAVAAVAERSGCVGSESCGRALGAAAAAAPRALATERGSGGGESAHAAANLAVRLGAIGALDSAALDAAYETATSGVTGVTLAELPGVSARLARASAFVVGERSHRGSAAAERFVATLETRVEERAGLAALEELLAFASRAEAAGAQGEALVAAAGRSLSAAQTSGPLVGAEALTAKQLARACCDLRCAGFAADILRPLALLAETKAAALDSFAQAGEAAFQFGVAGVGSAALYRQLQAAAATALESAPRRALRPRAVARCAARMAAAGVAADARYERALLVAAEGALERVGGSIDDTKVLGAAVAGGGRLSAFHPSALALLWRFQKQLPKPIAAGGNARPFEEPRFSDRDLPLCVDLGCGLGSFVLAAVAASSAEDCNWLGVDASEVAVGRASGAALRLGLSDRAQFLTGDAAATLASVAETYPGAVQLCAIHFPTPFRTLEDERQGEAALETQVHGGGAFMVNPALAGACAAALAPGGGVLLKSNSRDVLAAMAHELRVAGLGETAWPEAVAGGALAETEAASLRAGREVFYTYLSKSEAA